MDFCDDNAMARFFFNLHECGTNTPDEEGTLHDGIESVREEALRAARGIMCDEVSHGRLFLACCIDVTDESGRVVMTLPFRDALAVRGI